MKKITCESGTEIWVNIAFGVLNELEKGVYKGMDDKVLDRMMDKTTMKELEDSPVNAIFKGDTEGLRNFLYSTVDQSVDLIATVLRKIKPADEDEILEFPDFNARKAYVMDELDYDDGAKVVAEIQQRLQAGQENRARKGKSKPSLEKAKV